MQLPELLKRIAKHPQIGALAKILSNRETALTHVQGLQGSAAPVAFAALSERNVPIARPFLFILMMKKRRDIFFMIWRNCLTMKGCCFIHPPIVELWNMHNAMLPMKYYAPKF